MAVSVEAAFVLLDKASGPLKEIRRQALLTDKALRGMGGSGGIGTASQTRQYKTFGNAIGEVSKTTRTLGQETEKAAKKVEQAGGFFRRTFRDINNWRKALSDTHPVLSKTAAGIGGVLGGLKGLATAFPPVVSLAIVAAPAIVALAGAIGALASSLAGAVGGGVLLGGGLLGSFAVGIGSIVAVAKPAIDATKNYQKAVENLNKAVASGSPTAIKERQKELDALAKANPGVRQLAGNLKSFQSEWKKATAPGRESFFKLAADGIQTLRKLIPTLSGEANKNTAALQSSFQKILAPFLQSSQFRGLITGLGSIFRSNLPGVMRGVVNVFKGLSNILKILAPDLDKAGGAFQRFTGHFRRWTASTKGQGQIREMTRAFHAWWDLLKNIGRIMGTIAGVGMGRGTGIVTDWARKVGALADKLQTPAGHRGIDNFFKKSLDDAGKLVGLLKPIASDLHDIYTVFKPLGSATAFVIKNLPGPAVATLTALYAGIKVASGAKGAFSGIMDFLGKSRGSIGNPMHVWVDNSLPGGGGGGTGPKSVLNKVKDAITNKLPKGLTASAALRAAGAAGVPLTIAAVTAWLENTYGTSEKENIINSRRSDATGAPTINPLAASSLSPKEKAEIVARTRVTPPTPQGLAGMPPIIGGKSLTDIYVKTRKNTHDTINYINNQWLLGKIGVTGKYKDMASDVLKTSDYLHRQMHSKSKTARQQATKDWQMLKQNVVEQAQAMTATVVTSMNTMHDKIVSGSASAATQATTNFNTYATNIQAALKSGAMNAGEAAQLLGQGLNAMLKAFGQATIPTAGMSVKELMSWQNWWEKGGTGKTSNIGSGHGAQATGGRLPGKPQGDHIPLRSRGGNLLGIADGGELVVNRHTEAKADRLLAGYGTRLSDLVENETRPHYATGGRIFATGGRTASRFNPHPGARTASGDSGSGGGGGGNVWEVRVSQEAAASGTGWTELSPNGNAAARLGIAHSFSNNPAHYPDFASLGQMFPRGTMLKIRAPNGRSGTWPLTDVGDGSAFAPAIGLTPAVTGALGGLPSTVQITMGSGGNIHPYPGMARLVAGTGGFAAAGPGGGGMGAAPVMPHMPHINYPGKRTTMHNIVQGMLNKGVGAANKYIDAHQPAPSAGGGGGGGGGVGGISGPSGVGTFDGVQLADWIIPVLNWARQHGWGGTITSGYRPGIDPHTASGSSEHQGTQYPGGAIDVGDQFAQSQGQGLWNVIKSYPGPRNLIWAGNMPWSYGGSAHDYGHFSGNGHALGGRVPWYASGADFVANRPQVIGVGDAPGGERVTVTPKGQGRIGNQALHVEIHKIEVNRKGDVQKIVDEELQLLAASIERNL